ncbi:MAG: hypothetical protein WCT24_02490 [Patescibacteria group bacterium]
MFDDQTSPQPQIPTNQAPQPAPVQKPVEDIFAGSDRPAMAPPAAPPVQQAPSMAPPVMPPAPNPQLAMPNTGTRASFPPMPQKSGSGKIILIVIGVLVVLLIAGALTAMLIMDTPLQIFGNTAGTTDSSITDTEDGKGTLDDATTEPTPVKEEEPVDSDGDGLTDSEEETLGTDPYKADSDSDGLGDREEVKVYGTDALDPDTDKDTYLDGQEVKSGFNPNGAGKLYEIPE